MLNITSVLKKQDILSQYNVHNVGNLDTLIRV